MGGQAVKGVHDVAQPHQAVLNLLNRSALCNVNQHIRWEVLLHELLDVGPTPEHPHQVRLVCQRGAALEVRFLELLVHGCALLTDLANLTPQSIPCDRPGQPAPAQLHSTASGYNRAVGLMHHIHRLGQTPEGFAARPPEDARHRLVDVVAPILLHVDLNPTVQLHLVLNDLLGLPAQPVGGDVVIGPDVEGHRLEVVANLQHPQDADDVACDGALRLPFGEPGANILVVRCIGDEFTVPSMAFSSGESSVAK